MGLLRKLQVLNLQTNNLHFLPGPFDNLVGLKELYLSSNFLEVSLFASFRLPFLWLTCKCWHLGFSARTLRIFSSNCLGSRSQQVRVLCVLPPWNSCTGFTSFFATEKCRISRVGKTLGTLKSLKKLSLAHNNLSEMPAELGWFPLVCFFTKVSLATFHEVQHFVQESCDRWGISTWVTTTYGHCHHSSANAR